jgi:triacylglycerol lipase
MSLITPPNFSRDIAKECGKLIAFAYKGYTTELESDYDIIEILKAKPIDHLLFPDSEESFGFIVKNKMSGITFIIFRGTQTNSDWMANANIDQVKHPWGLVHEGFYEIYRQFEPVISNLSKVRVVISGHSLGGALATLAAANLSISGLSVYLYNFASPRVGDVSFVKMFNTNIPNAFSVINLQDIVPTLPPAIVHDYNYDSVGSFIIFSKHLGSRSANHLMSTYLEELNY